MLYAFIGHDGPDPQKRLDVRPAHLEHIKRLGERMVLAGPFLDGDTFTGSLMIIEAESLEEAEALFAEDPYMQNGVFESHTIKPFRVAINNLSAG